MGNNFSFTCGILKIMKNIQSKLFWCYLDTKKFVIVLLFLLGGIVFFSIFVKPSNILHTVEKKIPLLRLSPVNSSRERVLKEKLKDAYLIKDYAVQCELLMALAQNHLESQHYAEAAKLLNGALSIYHKQKEHIKGAAELIKNLIAEQKKVEVRFIEEQLRIPYARKNSDGAYGINPKHKDFLIELRKNTAKEIKALSFSSANQTQDTQLMYKFITKQIKTLLHTMVQDCIFLMKKEPPSNYALMGIGSISRDEITPYSDLEFVILISEKKQEVKRYFNLLSQLLELKIINLGETDVAQGNDLLPSCMASPILRGFSLDLHKNPLNQDYELITTPEELAEYQLPEHYVHEAGNHLSISLSTITFITGNSLDLVDHYQNEVNKIYRVINLKQKVPVYKIHALNVLKEDINQFESTIHKKNKEHFLKIKTDLYRSIQTVIDDLALYHGLKNHNTWDRIDELYTQGFILENMKDQLKKTFNIIALWRILVYNYYNSQQDVVEIHPRLDAKESCKMEEGLYKFTKIDTDHLNEIHKTLLSFYQKVKAAYIVELVH